MNRIEYTAVHINNSKKIKSFNAYLKKSSLSKKVTEATKAHKKQVKECKDALRRNKDDLQFEKMKHKMESKSREGMDAAEYAKRLEEVKARHRAELAELAELKKQKSTVPNQVLDDLKKSVSQSEHQLEEAKKHQIMLTLECLVQNGVSVEEIMKGIDESESSTATPDNRSTHSGKSLTNYM